MDIIHIFFLIKCFYREAGIAQVANINSGEPTPLHPLRRMAVTNTSTQFEGRAEYIHGLKKACT